MLSISKLDNRGQYAGVRVDLAIFTTFLLLALMTCIALGPATHGERTGVVDFLRETKVVLLTVTIVEIFFFIFAGLALYFLLRPLQRRLEHFLYKFFRSRVRGSGPVIDITDYSKKGKKDEQP